MEGIRQPSPPPPPPPGKKVLPNVPAAVKLIFTKVHLQVSVGRVRFPQCQIPRRQER